MNGKQRRRRRTRRRRLLHRSAASQPTNRSSALTKLRGGSGVAATAAASRTPVSDGGKSRKAAVADPSDGVANRESGEERDTGEQRERLGTWAKDSSRAAVSDGGVGLGGRAAAANRSGCLYLEQRWLDFGRISSSVFPAVRAATAASSRSEGRRDGGGNCTAAASGDGGAKRRRNRQRWLRTEAGYGSSYRLDGEASAL